MTYSNCKIESFPPIRQGLPQPERLLKLNDIAITRMRTLPFANNATTCNR